jgi:hypothetical protein
MPQYHKPRSRVVRTIGSKDFPAGVLGTVQSCDSEYVAVLWDDGSASVCSPDRVIRHQKLKAMFKHGPKIKKRSFGPV